MTPYMAGGNSEAADQTDEQFDEDKGANQAVEHAARTPGPDPHGGEEEADGDRELEDGVALQI
jgi:hypothetical protein